MNFSVISIGTELTLGLILNTNSRYIAEELTDLGLECNYMITVRDNEEDIVNSIKICADLSDIIIISGGLGPTDDDMTRSAVAKYFNVPLKQDRALDTSSLKFLKYIKNNKIKINLIRQSFIPEGSLPIKPRIGSASGFTALNAEKLIFSIPGVPREMRDMFDGDVIPHIRKFLSEKNFGAAVARDGSKRYQEKIIKKSVLLSTDISESQMEFSIRGIKPLASKLNIDIGVTANPGLIKIMLIARAQDLKQCENNLGIIEEKIREAIGEHIYWRGEGSIGDSIKQVIEQKTKKITVSTAESITGGLISSLITDAPGSSVYFLGSIVSYSNFVKENILGVSHDLINKEGAVSSKVCLSMAEKARRIFKSDFALSATGFAGPTSDEHDRDVGHVYTGIVGPDGFTEVYEKKFIGTRADIKFRTAQFILNRLRLAIIKF